MQRLLSDTLNYLRSLGTAAVRSWSEFFFTPSDPFCLGLMRIGLGSLLFWNLLVLGFDLRDYLGSDGWIGPEAIRHYLGEHTPGAWSLWFWIPDRWLSVTWVGCLIITFLFTVGLGTRFMAPVAWAIAVSVDRRAPVALFGFDHMIATWTLYLAVFGASGQSVSLDRLVSRSAVWRRGRKQSPKEASTQSTLEGRPEPTVFANLSLRMIQLHLAFVYGMAALSKLMGPEWWNGTAMEMIILTPEFIDLQSAKF